VKIAAGLPTDRKCVALALALGIFNIAAVAEEAAGPITTSGTGALTVCRSWVIFNSCNTYNRVVLPRRIAVGDKLPLIYGSNPKDYVFQVVGIRHQGNSCTILGEFSGAAADGERIEVTPCAAEAKP